MSAFEDGLVWLVTWTLHPQAECVKCRGCAERAAQRALQAGVASAEDYLLGEQAVTRLMPGAAGYHRATHDHKARVRRLPSSQVVVLAAE